MTTARKYEPFIGKSNIQNPITTVNAICIIRRKVTLIICDTMNSVDVTPEIIERSNVPEINNNIIKGKVLRSFF